MDYKMTIAGLERHLPLCKVTDELYIAGFIMFNDVEITKAVAKELLAKARLLQPQIAATCSLLGDEFKGLFTVEELISKLKLAKKGA